MRYTKRLVEYYKNLLFKTVLLERGNPPPPPPPPGEEPVDPSSPLAPIQDSPNDERGFDILRDVMDPDDSGEFPTTIPYTPQADPNNPKNRPEGIPADNWRVFNDGPPPRRYQDVGGGIGRVFVWSPGPPPRWVQEGFQRLPSYLPGHNPNLSPDHVILPEGWQFYRYVGEDNSVREFGLSPDGQQFEWNPTKGRWEPLPNPALYWQAWPNGSPPWETPNFPTYGPGGPMIIPPIWDPEGISQQGVDPASNPWYYNEPVDYAPDGRPIFGYDDFGRPIYDANDPRLPGNQPGPSLRPAWLDRIRRFRIRR